MNRIFSGMQPTGNLHLGNYLGALRNWVKLQDSYECFYCVVDQHALTIPKDLTKLAGATREVAALYIAAGIDSKKSALFVQSAIDYHTELCWVLGTFTPLGWLNRMTQFKEKSRKNADLELWGLYSYPVLMAADILLYKASHVPVGEDQKQHLEITRDIAMAFNRGVGKEYFALPEPLIMGEATRVMSLRDGTKKMSKSDESDYSRINLTDDADAIALKIRKAKTDTEPLPDNLADLEKRPEADNLVTIFAALANIGKSDVLKDHQGHQFSQFKKDLTEVAVTKLSPITTKMRELLADPAEIDRVLKDGAERANQVTHKHYAEVKDLMGFWKA
jgi:tryptophanyl-tRNA synthetase